jgi:hypothetical protein
MLGKVALERLSKQEKIKEELSSKLSSKIEVKKVDLSVSRAIFRLNGDFGKNEKIEIS